MICRFIVFSSSGILNDEIWTTSCSTIVQDSILIKPSSSSLVLKQLLISLSSMTFRLFAVKIIGTLLLGISFLSCRQNSSSSGNVISTSSKRINFIVCFLGVLLIKFDFTLNNVQKPLSTEACLVPSIIQFLKYVQFLLIEPDTF